MTRPRLPLLVVAVLLPLGISIVGIAVALGGLPAHELAVHWGPDGTPDGFAPSWTVVVGMGVLAVFGPLLFGIPLLASGRGGPSLVQKFLASTSLGFAALMAAIGCWTVLGQQDPAAAPPALGIGLGIGFGSAVVAGVLGWVLLPPVVPMPVGSTASAAPLPLAPGERAVWIGRTRLATGGLIAISGAVLFALCAAALVVVVTDGGAWPVLLVPAVLVLVLIGTSAWTLRADSTGLTVRSSLGWPVFRVPATSIDSAARVDVNPLGEFGGWGIRWGTGRRTGIVMRAGEALEVRRHGGRILVVTVDDAGTAASLLTAVTATPR
jgi:hypothetical protein